MWQLENALSEEKRRDNLKQLRLGGLQRLIHDRLAKWANGLNPLPNGSESIFIDTSNFLGSEDELWSDGTHFTPRGYEVFGERLADELTQNSRWRPLAER